MAKMTINQLTSKLGNRTQELVNKLEYFESQMKTTSALPDLRRIHSEISIIQNEIAIVTELAADIA